ncbi:MAG: glcG protein [Caulobacteraceae bacterium]|nr:glcG protein [Caulobacteraceae bacterium]
MQFKPSLSYDEAFLVAQACLAAAREQAVSVSIAVVDEAGGLLQFCRMDGARAFTVELATQKARAAASIGVSTRVLEALAKAGQLATVPAGLGGVPVMHPGGCAGAVGISGAKPEMDDLIAAKGAEAVLDMAEGDS